MLILIRNHKNAKNLGVFLLSKIELIGSKIDEIAGKINSTQVGFEPETRRLESWSTTTEPSSQ
jgi:hypothetical protein